MERSKAKQPSVDFLQDTTEINTTIIGGMERRDRLDVIHDRLQIPRLDKESYDIALLEDGLSLEADRLQRAAGPAVCTSPQHATSRGERQSRPAGARSPISPHGRVAHEALTWIFNSIELEPELLADRSKLRQLPRENNLAISRWYHRAPAEKMPGLHKAVHLDSVS